jgi:hypothetical protein
MTAGFDVILGNPPFLNQLETATVSTGAMANIVHLRSDGVIRGYTDLSATFLMMGSRWLASGGRLVLVQPQSFLAARDAAPVRTALLKDCSLTSLWVSNEHVFDDAAVYVCAPALQRDAPRSVELQRSATAKFNPLPRRPLDMDDLAQEETWSHLAAAASGVPELELRATVELGTVAEVTADFRDQYYGLDGFLLEDADVPEDRRHPGECPAIVTTGLIDLAECLWGQSSTRILKRKWQAPRVDRVRMNAAGSLGTWLTERLVPKVLVATQTRVLEVWVDDSAELVPSIPLLTVTPKPGSDIWLVAAAVASPVSAAVALCKYAGAALNADAIKLSASQLSRLPLPAEHARWQEGAQYLRVAHAARAPAERVQALLKFGDALSRAYGLRDSDAARVFQWWKERLGNMTDEEAADAET